MSSVALNDAVSYLEMKINKLEEKMKRNVKEDLCLVKEEQQGREVVVIKYYLNKYNFELSILKYCLNSLQMNSSGGEERIEFKQEDDEL